MMTLIFCEFTHLVREIERPAEVREPEILFQMVPVNHLPSAAELGHQLIQFITRERRNTTLAGHTFLRSQIAHNASSGQAKFEY
jgi:hypothetical protein